MGYLVVDQGEMLWHMGRGPEVEDVLAQLPLITSRLDSNYKQVLQARSALVESQLALAESRYPAARSAANKAINLAGANLNHTGVEAKLQLGLAEVRSGAKSQGLRTIQEALEQAKEINDEYLLSLAMLASSEALLENDDPAQARSVALEAQQRFRNRKQQDSEWQAWLIAARASQWLNDNAAQNQVAEAKKAFSELEKKWGKDAFDTYKSRRDVQAWQDQLNRLAPPN
jgi:ATP/maltotriose-dependent transcriptional regulator MalT